MFERFTEPARRTLFFARYETTELGGSEIEPEHFLLALLRGDRGPTLQVFAGANLSYTETRAEIRTHWGARQQVPTSLEMPFGDASKRILQYAAEEADGLGHTPVGTGHLLLGLLREEASVAADILKRHGITRDMLRPHLLDVTVASDAEPPIPAEGNAAYVSSGPVSAMMLLEGIRMTAEELARSASHGEKTQSLVNRIHSHVDGLKRHLAR